MTTKSASQSPVYKDPNRSVTERSRHGFPVSDWHGGDLGSGSHIW